MQKGLPLAITDVEADYVVDTDETRGLRRRIQRLPLTADPAQRHALEARLDARLAERRDIVLRRLHTAINASATKANTALGPFWAEVLTLAGYARLLDHQFSKGATLDGRPIYSCDVGRLPALAGFWRTQISEGAIVRWLKLVEALLKDGCAR